MENVKLVDLVLQSKECFVNLNYILENNNLKLNENNNNEDKKFDFNLNELLDNSEIDFMFK